MFPSLPKGSLIETAELLAGPLDPHLERHEAKPPQLEAEV